MNIENARQDPNGESPAVKHSNNWKGGRIKTPKGYIRIYKPDHPAAVGAGYVYEHRFVMEKFIGRFLLPTEIVHHKNEDKSDNEIGNLQICTGNAEHRRLHKKFRKCEQCGAPHKALGLCHACHGRRRYLLSFSVFCISCGKAMAKQGRPQKTKLCWKCWLATKNTNPCKECGGKPYHANGLCVRCYKRQWARIKAARVAQSDSEALRTAPSTPESHKV